MRKNLDIFLKRFSSKVLDDEVKRIEFCLIEGCAKPKEIDFYAHCQLILAERMMQLEPILDPRD